MSLGSTTVATAFCNWMDILLCAQKQDKRRTQKKQLINGLWPKKKIHMGENGALFFCKCVYKKNRAEKKIHKKKYKRYDVSIFQFTCGFMSAFYYR